MFDQLKKAVESEIQYIQSTFNEQEKLPVNERRKLGICLSPIEFRSEESTANASILTFRASYIINDSNFKRGAKVSLKLNSKAIEGRVVDVYDYTIQIFTDSEEEINWKDEQVEINFQPDDRTLNCMRLGIKLLEEHPRIQQFIPDFNSEYTSENLEIEGLNSNQQLAAGAILSTKKTVSIQGPPGTGKTFLLSKSIEQLVKNGKKIIVSAPSNTAVDNLAFRIKLLGIPVLRVGNEEKISPDLLDNTLDAWLEKSSDAKVLVNLKKTLQKASQLANRDIRNYTKEAADEKRAARKEVRELRCEIRTISRKNTQQLISSFQVIAGTPVGLFNALSKEHCADVVVLDEAGQCLFPLAILTASFGERFIQCGDPQQLSPTVLSQQAAKEGLSMSLLEFAHQQHPALLLNEQYRMDQAILDLVNPYFYSNQLNSASFLATGKVRFIDMAGFGEGETQNELGSTYNLDEVKAIDSLLKSEQFNPEKTVILSPYSAQITQISEKLGTIWRVSTIDSMQGQEAENILISLTRSNENQEIGFLKDYRRTNVAISRAKNVCYIIGDSATLGADSFYGELIQQLENGGNYSSVWELEIDD
ncbi:MAG: AAA domain-containing protein [Fluviicola sp.]